MSLLSYTGRDWTLEETPAGPRAVIPAPRLWPIAAFLAIWLAGWAAGEVSAAKALWELARSADGPLAMLPGAFLLAWLAGWTVGGAFALGLFLFSLDGRELVALREDRLLVRLETFLGIGWTWKLPLQGMAPPRLVTAEVPLGRLGAPPDGAQAQTRRFAHLVLQSGFRKWRLGLVMEESRAKDLLHTLNTRFNLPKG